MNNSAIKFNNGAFMRKGLLHSDKTFTTTHMSGRHANRMLKIINILFAVAMILKSALRTIVWYQESNDTAHYEDLYYRTAQSSWQEIIRDFSFWGQTYADRDLGYSFFVKFSQIFSVDFRFFLYLYHC